MRWTDLADAQPRLTEVMQRRLIDTGVLLVVTLRRDGTARLSPVEPLLLDGELWLSMMWGSRKAADLLRDPRLLVHSIVTSRDGGEGEVKLRGTARTVADRDIQARYAEAAAERLGWRPEVGQFHLFAVDIDDVSFIRYEDATGDQFLARWPAGEEFVRRGTTATSVGDPEPLDDLLVPDSAKP
jgi:pyridoxamine 5'-phosphate oxidase-like protein